MSVVISGGRPRNVQASYPLPTSPPTLYSAQPRTLDLLRGGLTITYEGIVRSQPWVFAAVSRLCWWTARIPFKLYDGELSDTRKRIYDGEPARLFKRPNPTLRWKPLMLEAMWDFYVNGHGLLLKYRRRPGQPPVELWNVPWRFVTPVVDQGDRIVGYNVSIGGQQTGLTPSDVVLMQWPRGIPPLEPLARTIQAEDAAIAFQVEMLRGGIAPRATFSTDKDLSPSDVERLRAELQKLYAGADAAGNFAILHKGLQFGQAVGRTPADLTLNDLRKDIREEIAACFDITPPFLGILERATFDNITELRESNTQDSLGPKLEIIQDSLQSQVLDCEPIWDEAGYYVECDFGAILKPNPEGQARQSLMEQQSSTTAIDERRRQRNLPPFNIKGVTDVPLIPENMYPAGSKPTGSGDSQLSDQLTAEAFKGGQRKPRRKKDEQ